MIGGKKSRKSQKAGGLGEGLFWILQLPRRSSVTESSDLLQLQQLILQWNLFPEVPLNIRSYLFSSVVAVLGKQRELCIPLHWKWGKDFLFDILGFVFLFTKSILETKAVLC